MGQKTLKNTTRAIMATIIVVVLLVPVVVVNKMATEKNRMILIIFACGAIIVALSGVTRITTWEMFLAAATYVYLYDSRDF
jgi:predicted glycosyltransferase involved in capsule biosynthesis